MCGICGFIDFKSVSSKNILDNMVSTLNHRGPDDRGSEIYNINKVTIGFGHTRLSIIDLSSLGHQPMQYEHFEIVFNGEIYNFEEIRKNLKELGHKFKSKSDTEVVLHAFVEWGEKCISKFIGMFAFVIFNKLSNEISVVRDRAGVKPLFYYWKDDLFLFSSELKAFHKHPKFIKKININAVYRYMDLACIPSPYCIFEDCKKLEPGHLLKLSLDKKEIEITKYWDVTDYYNLPKLEISYKEAKDEVEKLLISAFEYRMVSDVPVGVFLSGGFDSTAVVALLQHKRKEKLKTFTIGFEEGNNEAPVANEISNHLGTTHTEYICTPKEAKDVILKLPYYFDEPFADSSAIPTILVSKIAKKDVTVALSGDAGDEIFAGYQYYDTFFKHLKILKKIPHSCRFFLSKLFLLSNKLIPSSYQRLKRKFETLSILLFNKKERQFEILHNSYFSLSSDLRSKLFKDISPTNLFKSSNSLFNIKDNLSFILASDYKGYLQNDILTKVDRATMSVSLEGREPFLDHRIVEYVAQLPNKYKYNGGIKKRILKDIVYKYVPKEIIDQPKNGFSLPIEKWLKEDLRFLIDDNLNRDSLETSNIFNIDYVNNLIKMFDNNHLNDPTIIWRLIQFQMWYKRWM